MLVLVESLKNSLPLEEKMPIFKTFKGKVSENRYITHDVIFLRLLVPETFTFKAGQFANIKIEKEGKVRHTPYSVLNPPSEKGKIDLCLDVIENGFSSPVLRDTKIGEELEISGPFGNFIFNEKDAEKEHWLIGTGTGMVPLYSMIKEFVPRMPDHEFVLLLGVQKQQDLLLHQELHEFADLYDNFQYVPTLSREEWQGKTGRVQRHLENEDLRNKTFYICGLKEMVTETRELLLKKGVPANKIYFERFN